MPRTSKQDRLLVTHPFRHYRRTYSMREVRWGLLVPLVLAAILAWVLWKGANPDPELHAAAPLAGGDGSTPLVTKRPPESSPGAPDRGPLPAKLAGDGWREGPVTRFTKENLYVKINGRADYFISFGFERLYFTSLAYGTDGATTIDIETYDMGSPANALGAFSGERKTTDRPRVSGGAMAFAGRNALFLTRGKYYVRAIGSDESDVVKRQLAHLEKALVSGMRGESRLPWAYELFVKRLEYDPAKVMYLPANALSFEFGRDVYTARDDGDLLLFAIVTGDEAAARALAGKFVGGLASYGKKLPSAGPVIWIKDQYTGTLATATSTGKFVLGLRGAPDAATAKATLAKLSLGLSELPASVRERARPAPKPHARPQKEDDSSAGAEPGSTEDESSAGAEPGSTEEL